VGKTSAAVKDRYNAKVYDDLRLRLKKGEKQKLHDFAAARGESLNGFINRAIAETMEREKDEADQ